MAAPISLEEFKELPIFENITSQFTRSTSYGIGYFVAVNVYESEDLNYYLACFCIIVPNIKISIDYIYKFDECIPHIYNTSIELIDSGQSKLACSYKITFQRNSPEEPLSIFSRAVHYNSTVMFEGVVYPHRKTISLAITCYDTPEQRSLRSAAASTIDRITNNAGKYFYALMPKFFKSILNPVLYATLVEMCDAIK